MAAFAGNWLSSEERHMGEERMGGICLTNIPQMQYSLPLGFLIKPRMPVVDRIGGLRVVIWPNDHRPAHVHVIGPNGEAVFNLHCPGGPPELRESFGFRLGEVNVIAEALRSVIPALCDEWSKIHGRY
jgi:hypothetical protein